MKCPRTAALPSPHPGPEEAGTPELLGVFSPCSRQPGVDAGRQHAGAPPRKTAGLERSEGKRGSVRTEGPGLTRAWLGKDGPSMPQNRSSCRDMHKKWRYGRESVVPAAGWRAGRAAGCARGKGQRPGPPGVPPVPIPLCRSPSCERGRARGCRSPVSGPSRGAEE